MIAAVDFVRKIGADEVQQLETAWGVVEAVCSVFLCILSRVAIAFSRVCQRDAQYSWRLTRVM